MKETSEKELIAKLLDSSRQVLELGEPVLVEIKPYMQGVVLYGHEIRPTYGITKIAAINGELVYITDHGDQELYIFSNWVQDRVPA
jgi:hypothetical protein